MESPEAAAAGAQDLSKDVSPTLTSTAPISEHIDTAQTGTANAVTEHNNEDRSLQAEDSINPFPTRTGGITTKGCVWDILRHYGTDGLALASLVSQIIKRGLREFSIKNATGTVSYELHSIDRQTSLGNPAHAHVLVELDQHTDTLLYVLLLAHNRNVFVLEFSILPITHNRHLCCTSVLNLIPFELTVLCILSSHHAFQKILAT